MAAAARRGVASRPGPYRVVSFAQSFHWMDQLQVARVALRMLEDGGACVHVHATTHQGVDTDAVLPHPRPPRSAIDELVERYLGPIRRKGARLGPIARKWFGEQQASTARSESRFRARSWSAPAIRLWRAFSRSRAPRRTCSGNAAKRSNPIFGDCWMMPTPAGSSASRCVKSPRTSGDREGAEPAG